MTMNFDRLAGLPILCFDVFPVTIGVSLVIVFANDQPNLSIWKKKSCYFTVDIIDISVKASI